MENNYYYQPTEMHPSYQGYIPPVKKDNTSTIRILIPLMTLISSLAATGLNSLVPIITNEFQYSFDTYESLFLQYLTNYIAGSASIIIELALILAVSYALTKSITDSFKFFGCHAIGEFAGTLITNIISSLFTAISLATDNTQLSSLSVALTVLGFVQIIISVAATAGLTFLATKKSKQ